MIVTTLNRIRAHIPYTEVWSKLLTGLGKTCGDDEPLPYAEIVRINGLHDALWCCRAEPQHAREWRLFAVWCARQVQHLMTDPRSLASLDVTERHANGLATDKELSAAKDAAKDAAWAARDITSWDAAWSAAWAATRTAWFAPRAVAWDAACAARDAARDAQTAEFLRIVSQKDDEK
jgi:hypothetical protein